MEVLSRQMTIAPSGEATIMHLCDLHCAAIRKTRAPGWHSPQDMGFIHPIWQFLQYRWATFCQIQDPTFLYTIFWRGVLHDIVVSRRITLLTPYSWQYSLICILKYGYIIFRLTVPSLDSFARLFTLNFHFHTKKYLKRNAPTLNLMWTGSGNSIGQIGIR